MRWYGTMVSRRVASRITLAAVIVAAAALKGGNGPTDHPVVVLRGIHKIQHVVVIMQENRSFDSYFGTYPGADGIPLVLGVPTVCAPDAKTGTCVAPYPDHQNVNIGGPHGSVAARQAMAGGKMNGFVNTLVHAPQGCPNVDSPGCVAAAAFLRVGGDVMGYHTQSDIPNYWTYAHDFVLQDHMFEPNASWSLPEHLFQVSEWSALCTNHNPLSCRNALETPRKSKFVHGHLRSLPPIYAWTDLTYLMHRAKVSWGYYVVNGTEPDCEDNNAVSCAPAKQYYRTPGIWNPLPYFDTVRSDHQVGNIQSVDRFYGAAQSGTLPSVSWVVPSGDVSEHPPSRISAGQSYVTSLINAIMRSPDWNSTAIFLAWDDWGGFYDHVTPPKVDQNGYGLRVPAMVINSYAKAGVIDHQTLSFDAYVKFIEDDFLNGQRLNPRTDGRPDGRPTVRESEGILGNLANDFNFNQPPRDPILLPVHPKTTLIG